MKTGFLNNNIELRSDHVLTNMCLACHKSEVSFDIVVEFEDFIVWKDYCERCEKKFHTVSTTYNDDLYFITIPYYGLNNHILGRMLKREIYKIK